jgi:hypothetical protein
MKPFVLLTLVTLGSLAPTEGARAGIPIVWGAGDTVSHINDLPPNSPIRQADPLLPPDKVGFKYWRFHVFWLPLWTSEGEFVAYHNEKHGKFFKLGPDPIKAAHLIGVAPGDLAVPFTYRFPPGWWVAGGFLVYLVGAALFRQNQRKPEAQPASMSEEGSAPTEDVDAVAQLLADPRYEQALRLIHADDPVEVTATEIRRGVEYLIEQGVAPPEAEANVDLLLRALREEKT